MTYTLIDSEVLASSAASVTFSSIPADYRDLVVVIEALGANSSSLRVQFNADTASNYSQVTMAGDGSSASSAAFSDDNIQIAYYAGILVGERNLILVQIMDYSATDKHTTVLSRNNRASSGVEATAGRWANTAAVNQIRIYQAQLDVGSTISIYGIAS